MRIFQEIKNIIKYFRVSKKHPEITFYSENGIYFQNFKGAIEKILKYSEFNILYITSDINDPVWDLDNDRIMPFYINKLIPLIFPFINTKTLILTMTDLDKFHVKRSTNPVNHIYMFHAINSIHLQYNNGAFDNYDTIFCVGPHHVKEIRKSEEIYNLPAKTLVEVGYSWLEEIESKYESTEYKSNKILIAPTWSSGNILESCIETLLERLLPLTYDIIVRPHPEFIKRQKNKITQLQNKYSNNPNLTIETESTSTKNIFESSMLITDWSGIAIEYAWGMLKPVIYIDTPKKIHNPDYKDLGIVPIEDSIRQLNGVVLKISECDFVETEIEKAFQLNKQKQKTILDLRNKNIFNWGNSSNVAAEYIINYCNGN